MSKLLTGEALVTHRRTGALRSLQMATTRTLNGAIAGGLAAAAWAGLQPLDKRLFGTSYDDVEVLGKAVTRGSEWPVVGLALHVGNGAVFGALYSHLRPFLFGPPVLRAVTASLAEHFGTWPLARLSDEHHPAKRDLPTLAGDRRMFAQA